MVIVQRRDNPKAHNHSCQRAQLIYGYKIPTPVTGAQKPEQTPVAHLANQTRRGIGIMQASESCKLPHERTKRVPTCMRRPHLHSPGRQPSSQSPNRLWETEGW
ncbi:hypothetical protein PoMZ_05082 [Pyricularia oryzae]|uniref:Uncharacterized protein n=1 Tax=Pyricularia oryzae TaxID=318829 RepID=A0A4P7NMF9_PYROR|nr:hypothetical protein PoMZ_05082 [Pyricularia oryzae]